MIYYLEAFIILGVFALLVVLTIHLSHNINMGRKRKEQNMERRIVKDVNGFYRVQINFSGEWRTVYITPIYENAVKRM